MTSRASGSDLITSTLGLAALPPFAGAFFSFASFLAGAFLVAFFFSFGESSSSASFFADTS
jgi:hypothetical protein